MRWMFSFFSASMIASNLKGLTTASIFFINQPHSTFPAMDSVLAVDQKAYFLLLYLWHPFSSEPAAASGDRIADRGLGSPRGHSLVALLKCRRFYLRWMNRSPPSLALEKPRAP